MKRKNLTEKEILSLALENHKKNNFSIAEKFYKQVLEINPSHFESIFYLASLSAQTKNFNMAKEMFEKAVKIQPDYAAAYSNLGAVLKELGNFKGAMAACEKAIAIEPNNSIAFSNLGAALKELGNFKQAITACEKAIKIEPNNLDAHHNLALALQELGEIKKAIICYEKLSKIQSNPANAYQNLGKLYVMLGESKEAKNFYQLATKYDPENLSYYYNLSDLDRKILDKNFKKKIDKIIIKKKHEKKNLAYANFLLSKYELNSKNYEKELNYLIKGHQNFFDSNIKKFKLEVKYCFDDVLQISKGAKVEESDRNKVNEIKPILIIGVPRSGSTLVEKIIASGKKLIPMGEETAVLEKFFTKTINEKHTLNLGNVDTIRSELYDIYKEKGLISEKCDYIFTDKSLSNFFYLDLIKIIYPNAKIINCKRNVLSSIMSIFQNNLTQLAWAHNLENIFKYFDNYFKIIKQFNKIYPNFIYNLEYEKLVNSPEEESKKIMKFCELPWDKKCLEFYKRKDLISKTASNIQIRRAVYKHSVDKYIPYKKLLDKYGKKYSWFN